MRTASRSARSTLFLALVLLVAGRASAESVSPTPPAAPCAALDAATLADLLAMPVADAPQSTSASTAAVSIDELLGRPPRRGYCRCGCGARCATDADCGPGGSCVAFISCC